jgi:hypothetical protein
MFSKSHFQIPSCGLEITNFVRPDSEGQSFSSDMLQESHPSFVLSETDPLGRSWAIQVHNLLYRVSLIYSRGI